MLKEAFRIRAEYFDLQPRYNIAPGQDIPVVTRNTGGREISAMRWGLIPHWAGDEKIGYKMINARAETVNEKPAFKSSFRRRRCLIPASGFYEWKRDGKVKQPVLITLPGQRLFAFAGIWEHWDAPDGRTVYSCSIITTEAAKKVAHIHNRMPVMLTGEKEYETWLSLDEPPVLRHLMQPYGGELQIYPVSTRVNSPRDDDPGLIERVD